MHVAFDDELLRSVARRVIANKFQNFFFFFFFKQKTAYEISLGLVGSEMCIETGDLKTAWGIHPEESKPHRAMFVFEKPLTALKGETMEIELRQLHGGSHLIGRPRLSVTNAAKPALIEILPQDVGQALAIEPAKRTNEQIKVLTLYFSREANAKEVAALGAVSYTHMTLPTKRDG